MGDRRLKALGPGPNFDRTRAHAGEHPRLKTPIFQVFIRASEYARVHEYSRVVLTPDAGVTWR
jgi:hypothetical protein